VPLFVFAKDFYTAARAEIRGLEQKNIPCLGKICALASAQKFHAYSAFGGVMSAW